MITILLYRECLGVVTVVLFCVVCVSGRWAW